MRERAEGLETYRNVVYPWQCDAMGHMNTQFYAAAFDAAGFGALSRVESLPRLLEAGFGWADIRQLIEYRHEVPSGCMIVIRSRVVRLGNSSITVLHTMTDDQDEPTLRATSETTSVLFDLKRRKAAPIEGELRERASRLPTVESAEAQ